MAKLLCHQTKQKQTIQTLVCTLYVYAYFVCAYICMCNECLANFLIGEAKLENYLEENAPIESNFAKSKTGLQDARRCLQLVTGENGQKAGIALDAYLLLAKLCYACGEYEKTELNTLAEKELTLRSLKILAESYAIKAEKEAEMITCFERATDLGLLYLQEQDIASYSSATNSAANAGSMLAINTTGNMSGMQSSLGGSSLTISTTIPTNPLELKRHMGAILETALQLAFIMETNTQSLRLTLARQLAEVLLRGVSGTIYTAPFTKKPAGQALRSTATKRLWKPRKYAARNQFTPRNHHEETLLLLLISEALAVRDTVLSQSPEFRVARQHAMGNASAVYDLLTLATVRWGLVNMLQESFEKR
ncbi:unnamed protein product [Ceratitis capitata]|uniref:(Mediterranean fruit fly) hypothetical protein n=1 Tax=Ceratitis capitata TaxID=7213 RepID=A0A811V929_CERCA|nr:unnamed protein product [Ceratitis capitata]